MRIVLCHNYFRERGGEDQVFEDEVALLTTHGHDVATFVRHNSELNGIGDTIRTAIGTPWNRGAAVELEDLVRRTNADIVHFHNWLPQISPAGFYAARKGGAAVIQTLHNYRWACPNGMFFRNGSRCEDCLGKRFPWPAIRHSCYHSSAVGSGFVASALALHNMLRTTSRAIDAFITPGAFIKDKLTAAGLPGDRIFVKPNFLPVDPGPGTGRGGYAMYLGRLSPEKKIDTLLAAWERLEGRVPLKISGAGPLRPEVEAAADRDPSIEYLGFAPKEALDGLLGSARVLVFTSGTYEAQPMTILETYAKGTPVIAASLGAMEELVEDGKTGWHFNPNDPEDLARIVADVFRPSVDLAEMRKTVHDRYLERFTPELNHELTMSIYEGALRYRRSAD